MGGAEWVPDCLVNGFCCVKGCDARNCVGMISIVCKLARECLPDYSVCLTYELISDSKFKRILFLMGWRVKDLQG